MPAYHITEPHPSLSNTIKFGRGGAGNTTRAPAVTHGPSASGPASRLPLAPPPSTAYFAAGRGGAGNLHRDRERAIFSFDEELAHQDRLRQHAAPVYHVGRGGAGNLVDALHPRRAGSASSSSRSDDDDDADKDAVRRSLEGAWLRVARQFGRSS